MKTSATTTIILRAATLLLIAASASACGPSPEKAGDECDVDDGCPTGLVCGPGPEEDTICLIPQGGVCDPAVDYCQGDLVCGAGADGKGKCGLAEGATCDPKNSACAGGLSCAELSAGGFACYPSVLVKGQVRDSQTTKGIASAHVLALDDQSTAMTDIAVSDASGNYVLDLPVPRGADGAPEKDLLFTLRGSASGYQTFPGGLRTALPLSTSEIKADGKGWTIDTTLTDVVLIALPMDQQGLPSIAGNVVTNDDRQAGVLVVADNGSGAALSAISDRKGAYTIFNVPNGMFKVRGYAAGLQLTPVDAAMNGMALTGVNLAVSENALGKISGNVGIVNAPGGSATSVVLVVKSTFDNTFVRGEVPRGLRTPLTGAPNVTGAFTITDVPEGEYVVLAAFENDGLVRDPDPNIAGTQLVSVTMPSPGMDVPLPESFKITAALEVFGPGVTDPEPVTAAPMLRWADDSSEDFYTVVVYNAYGERVWCLSDQMMGCDGPNVPGVSGKTEVSVMYGGPMEPGMYYQFRATSWRSPGGSPGPAATTEDLRGVFYVDVAP
jgi:hypothetical protein